MQQVDEAPSSLAPSSLATAGLTAQHLFDTTPDPAWVVDLEGVCLAANDSAACLVERHTPAAMLGVRLETLLPAESAAALRTIMAQALHSGGRRRVQVHVPLPGGAQTWWDVWAWRLDAAPGQPHFHLDGERPAARIALWWREVTAARLTDVELRGQAAIQRRILADAPLTEVLEDVCRLAEQLLPGRLCLVKVVDDTGTMLRNGVGPSIPAELREAISALPIGPRNLTCGAAAHSGLPALAADVAIHPAWADYQEVARRFGLASCWSMPLTAGGVIMGTFAAVGLRTGLPQTGQMARLETCSNLAALALEQAKTRRSRAQMEHRFATAAGLIPGYLFVTDAAGRLLYNNSYLVDQCGLTPAQAAGSGWRLAMHPDDLASADEKWRSARRSGQGYDNRFRFRMASGGFRWHLGRIVPQTDLAGTVIGWIGITLDIDELVAGREMLQRYRTELETLVEQRTAALAATAAELQAEMHRREQAQAALAHSQKIEALGQLTGGVAHDFNNILAAITGCLELIDRRAAEPGLQRLAQNGLAAAGRAAGLVRQLLAIARREVPSPTLVEVQTALPAMQDLLRHAVTSAIRLRIEVADDVWPLFVDGPQLETSLLNLAVNARDAMKDGGSLVIAAANCPAGAPRPAGVRDRDAVCISVQDSGCGIDPGLVDRIFEPFFTTKPRGEGTGLGLAMVRSFVQQAGGDIAVAAVPEGGTLIALYLPRAAAGMAEQVLPVPEPAASGATVLVVDDDGAVRDITCALLREAGYRVVEAGGGPVALALLQTAEAIDLVVTDLAMPGMDGVALARHLRAERPGLPIVFVTGFADRTDLSGEIVVPKPFTAATLARAMHEAMARQPARGLGHDEAVADMRSGVIRAAYARWHSLRGSARLPSFGQLTLAGRDWSDHAFIVSVDMAAEPPRFGWVSVGPALARRLPRGADAVPGPGAEAVLGSAAADYARCAESGVPLHAVTAEFERLLLPVTSERGGVTHLVGLVVFAGG